MKVTGFSSQFDTEYEIDPRFQPDVVGLPAGDGDRSPALSSPPPR